ncbi:MAG: type II toxin-antitoxin system RelE/ParE family toxin [Phycisphaerales bacterium]
MIRYLPSADLTLEHHAAYIGERNPDAATRFLQAVRAAVSTLADNPRKAPAIDFEEHRLFEIRSLGVPGFRHHRVIYRLAGSDVEVLLIFHTSQNPRRLRDV